MALDRSLPPPGAERLFRMISARMSRPAQVFLAFASVISLAALISGCGTQKISLTKSDPNYAGAVLFNQRCSGCHTLRYAAANGSAANVRTAQYNNGPNFNVRCERPVTRVLYAIENGGFSGAIMPQNVVVGQQAIEVAKFVATYAGRSAPKVPGVPDCQQKAVGAIPSLSTTTTATTTQTTKATKVTSKAPRKVRTAKPTARKSKSKHP